MFIARLFNGVWFDSNSEPVHRHRYHTRDSIEQSHHRNGTLTRQRRGDHSYPQALKYATQIFDGNHEPWLLEFVKKHVTTTKQAQIKIRLEMGRARAWAIIDEINEKLARTEGATAKWKLFTATIQEISDPIVRDAVNTSFLHRASDEKVKTAYFKLADMNDEISAFPGSQYHSDWHERRDAILDSLSDSEIGLLKAILKRKVKNVDTKHEIGAAAVATAAATTALTVQEEGSNTSPGAEEAHIPPCAFWFFLNPSDFHYFQRITDAADHIDEQVQQGVMIERQKKRRDLAQTILEEKYPFKDRGMITRITNLLKIIKAEEKQKGGVHATDTRGAHKFLLTEIPRGTNTCRFS